MLVRAVPPFRGELGILLRFHAAAVRALDRPLLVVHEPGLEAVYPDVERELTSSTRPDIDRRWNYAHDGAYVGAWRDTLRARGHELVEPDKTNRLPIRPFRPEPFVRQRPDASSHVVVCPRRRAYGPSKNWDAWPVVAAGIRKTHSVFVAGLPETSYDVPADERAWDYERPLDATIEAMRTASLVVATASGLSLLAVMCGAPLLLVASRGGLVAPGPTGAHPRYWRIPVADYYDPLNHSGSLIDVVDRGWQRPIMVVQRARARAASPEGAFA